MANFINKLFQIDKKRLKKIEDKAREIDALKDKIRQLSDEELKAKTEEFKNRLSKGETLDDIMVEAYAVAREACYRVRNEFPFLVQLMGAIVLHQGDIAEMKTGEGKTLTSVMPAYLNALGQKGVHIITVNEYLAARDAKNMGAIHQFLGLSVGVNLRELSSLEKRRAYEADITYSTNAEIGFDYLRDNMVTDKKDRVQRPLNYAIIDEVDSILIDESRTPLIISGGKRNTANMYKAADAFAKSIKIEQDFDYDIKTKTVQLNEEGVNKAEKFFGIDNLYEVKYTNIVHHINQALKANYTMQKDVEYVVQDGEIVIVDQFTGRLMKGRAFSDGLHQALEAKENVAIKQETSTLATITYQNLFRLYNKLSGMTGTAKTEEEEFLTIYNMRVIEIPTNKPMIRIDAPDAIYGSKSAKFNALVEDIKERHAKGQPILVGTISVETSEMLSARLKKEKIKHEVLNAKNHSREAEIIAKAGEKGNVTIATNMAGRGTDIKLGEGVLELGGLAVLGSERHESRRIDNQLRGRAGRQGDPGYSQFYVSMEDELMIRFGSEKLKGLFSQLKDMPIESNIVSKSIASAQMRVEGNHFDVRKSLLEYDDVLRQQREIMYQQRNEVLDHEDVHGLVKDMFKHLIEAKINSFVDFNEKDPTVDYEGLINALNIINITNPKLETSLIINKNVEEVKTVLLEHIWQNYEEKISFMGKPFYEIERIIVLKTIDRNWIEHIDEMSKLRDGIYLRAYAQTKPIQAYIEEGYAMFESMLTTIANEVVMYLCNVRIQVKE